MSSQLLKQTQSGVGANALFAPNNLQVGGSMAVNGSVSGRNGLISYPVISIADIVPSVTPSVTVNFTGTTILITGVLQGSAPILDVKIVCPADILTNSGYTGVTIAEGTLIFVASGNVRPVRINVLASDGTTPIVQPATLSQGTVSTYVGFAVKKSVGSDDYPNGLFLTVNSLTTTNAS